MTRGHCDRGDIVLSWLTKLTATLAVLGVIGFDLIAIGVGRMQAEDRAITAGRAAVSSYSGTEDVQAAYDAAVRTLTDGSGGDTGEVTIDPTTFTVDGDGAVTLTVQRTASTLLVEKVGPIRHWAVSRATTTISRSR